MVTSRSAKELAWLIFNSTAARASAARTISPAEHRNTNLKRRLSIELPLLGKLSSIILGGSLLMAQSYSCRDDRPVRVGSAYNLPTTSARRRGINRSAILEQKRYWRIPRGPSANIATIAFTTAENFPASTAASATLTSMDASAIRTIVFLYSGESFSAYRSTIMR